MLGSWVSETILKPFKKGPYGALGPLDINPFSKPDILRAHLSGTGLKDWGVWYWAQTPYSSRKNSELWDSSPSVRYHAGGQVWARVYLCLFYLSQCGPFILWCRGAVHLVFRFFFQNELFCMYIWCVHKRREVQDSPMLPSWTAIQSFLVTNFLHVFFCSRLVSYFSILIPTFCDFIYAQLHTEYILYVHLFQYQKYIYLWPFLSHYVSLLRDWKWWFLYIFVFSHEENQSNCCHKNVLNECGSQEFYLHDLCPWILYLQIFCYIAKGMLQIEFHC